MRTGLLHQRGILAGQLSGGAGREDARVTGMAVLPSESLRAENAEIHLLAGSVAGPTPGAPPQPLMEGSSRPWPH